MANSFSSRRSIPRYVLLVAGVLTVIFVLNAFISGRSSSQSQFANTTLHQRQQDAATNPLSPPTKPLRANQDVLPNGRAMPPPVVRYSMNNLSASSRSAANNERVLILTPLAKFYSGYWENLKRLTYPRHLISLGFVVPKSADGGAALKALEKAIASLQSSNSGEIDQRFASVTILRHEFGSLQSPPPPPPPSRQRANAGASDVATTAAAAHREAEKRKILALARNSLLSTTIGPSTSWVLWMDGDIVWTPPSLIQDLTKHDKGILVPNAMQRVRNPATREWERRPYDLSSWVDSDAARDLARQMDKNRHSDEVLMEGFSATPTQRMRMAQMADLSPEANPSAATKLDSVGSKVLLVKADVHRDGVMFPPFSFYRLIESEGFARMARRLQWECWGLPNYFVRYQLYRAYGITILPPLFPLSPFRSLLTPRQVYRAT